MTGKRDEWLAMPEDQLLRAIVELQNLVSAQIPLKTVILKASPEELASVAREMVKRFSPDQAKVFLASILFTLATFRSIPIE